MEYTTILVYNHPQQKSQVDKIIGGFINNGTGGAATDRQLSQNSFRSWHWCQYNETCLRPFFLYTEKNSNMI